MVCGSSERKRLIIPNNFDLISVFIYIKKRRGRRRKEDRGDEKIHRIIYRNDLKKAINFFFIWRMPDDEEKADATAASPEEGAAPPTYEGPSIEKAWEYYHSCLPRRIKVTKTSGASSYKAQQGSSGTGFRMAGPGETQDPLTGEPAELYDIWDIFDFGQLDEFGIGISLYFRQLILLFFIILVCACVNLHTITTNKDIINSRMKDTPGTLLGSVYGATREDLSFSRQGLSDIITMAILIVFILCLKKFEEKNVEDIDLSQQTTQDYAIRVTNLPDKLNDPDEYRDFFKKWGDVVFVSLAPDNGELLKSLADMRELEEVLRARQAADLEDTVNGKPIVRQAELPPDKLFLQQFGLYMNTDYLNAKKEATMEKIKALVGNKSARKNKAVYVVFNTEKSQRQCLKDCATGFCEEMFNTQCCSLTDKSMFKGKCLRIDEPVEPNSVIYENLHIGPLRYAWGMAKSYCCTFFLLLISFLILQAASVSVPASDSEDTEKGASGAAAGAAIMVSLINGMLPFALKVITLKMELHHNEGGVQTSILRKLMVARCLNTAVLMYVVTDWRAQFSKANLEQIQSILIADCVTTPILRALNVYEKVMHNVVAPTKKTQGQMNVLFQGAYWNLAERYTDMIKTLFVGLFYSTIIPSSLFITSATMLVTYIVDRYCLLRMWKRAPAYNEQMATASRKMIIVCVWVHIIMARVFFANWPYKNKDEKPSCHLLVCWWGDDPDVPAGDENKWTADQESVVQVFTITGVFMFLWILYIFFIGSLIVRIKKLFCQIIDVTGRATTVEFR